ncbi:MAG: hypothetical protein QNJ27_01245 [Simkaniaceae bacterium]|nr:hypothetical protein [Simkaniaceae bacterium]
MIYKIKELAYALQNTHISSSELVEYTRRLEDVRKNLQIAKSLAFKEIENTKTFVKFLHEEDNYRRTLGAL